MGQYFMAVNCTKREYFTAWELDGGAKLFEWCANAQAGVFPYLLRKSNEGGGGDISNLHSADYAGRWAGDQVYLVGDYDESGLYEHAKRHFRTIAKELATEYNQFIGIKERQLTYLPT